MLVAEAVRAAVNALPVQQQAAAAGTEEAAQPPVEAPASIFSQGAPSGNAALLAGNVYATPGQGACSSTCA